MNSDPLKGFAPQIPQIFSQQWGQILALIQPAGQGAQAAAPAPLRFDMQKLTALQQDYQRELTRLLSHAGTASEEPLKDKRFAADSWRSHPGAALMAHMYLLNSRTLLGLADALQADEKTRRRVRFAVEQWSAAFAPSNMLAFNPEAQQKLLSSTCSRAMCP
jgi:polyhydroxyalkanoate synthase